MLTLNRTQSRRLKSYTEKCVFRRNKNNSFSIYSIYTLNSLPCRYILLSIIENLLKHTVIKRQHLIGHFVIYLFLKIATSQGHQLNGFCIFTLLHLCQPIISSSLGLLINKYMRQLPTKNRLYLIFFLITFFITFK